MRLCGEMRDAGKAVLTEKFAQQFSIVDRAFNKVDLTALDQRLKAGRVGSVSHSVDDGQLVIGAPLAPSVNQILADESGSAGDQNVSQCKACLVPDTVSLVHEMNK
jgi:hypothetical protein